MGMGMGQPFQTVGTTGIKIQRPKHVKYIPVGLLYHLRKATKERIRHLGYVKASLQNMLPLEGCLWAWPAYHLSSWGRQVSGHNTQFLSDFKLRPGGLSSLVSSLNSLSLTIGLLVPTQEDMERFGVKRDGTAAQLQRSKGRVQTRSPLHGPVRAQESAARVMQQRLCSGMHRT